MVHVWMFMCLLLGMGFAFAVGFLVGQRDAAQKIGAGLESANNAIRQSRPSGPTDISAKPSGRRP